ncbi:MAG: hypothetical protein QOG15_2214 [Solirubrobacteraceae bacterium]|jgi:hypothetical protein|nr:hypothetical protein [Solirubrobacteraceae bacterium]
MSDGAEQRPPDGAEPRRVRVGDLKPGDVFTTDRAEGEFVVESVDGASAYRIIRTTGGKVFGLPRQLAVWVHADDSGGAD